jgi:uncharacterized protein (DUF1499 family)
MKISILLLSLVFNSSLFANPLLEDIKNCPSSPNCVSTLTNQEDKKLAPISWQNRLSPIDEIEKIILSMERTKVLSKTENSLHVIFISSIFRFKDDVIFYYDEEAKLIHFKSQSRIGYSDLGVNKKRMEEISNRIEAIK